MKPCLSTATFIVVTSLLTISNGSFAQKTGLHEFSGGINFQAGYRKNNIDQLNSALGKNGLPTLSDNNIWYNLSFTHDYKHVITELGLGFTIPSKTDVNSIKTSYYQDQFFFRAGYNIANSSDFRLYPFAGINVSRAVLQIKDNRSSSNTNNFNTQLLTPTLAKTIHQNNFGIDLGAGFDYLIKLKSKQIEGHEIHRTLPLGIRAGYYFQTSASKWKFDENSIDNSPQQKTNSFFATISIGLGYLITK